MKIILGRLVTASMLFYIIDARTRKILLFNSIFCFDGNANRSVIVTVGVKLFLNRTDRITRANRVHRFCCIYFRFERGTIGQGNSTIRPILRRIVRLSAFICHLPYYFDRTNSRDFYEWRSIR